MSVVAPSAPRASSMAPTALGPSPSSAHGRGVASMPSPSTPLQRLPAGSGNTQARPLDKFIVLQGASGAFLLDDRFAAATSLSIESISSALPASLKAAVPLLTQFLNLLL